MTAPAFGLILLGVLLGAGAQLLLKAGTNALGPLAAGTAGAAVETAVRVMAQPAIVAGLTLYVVSAAVWIVALSRVEVSVAYPMLSIGFVVNAIAAWALLGESVGAQRLAGIAVIVVGVFLVARSA